MVKISKKAKLSILFLLSFVLISVCIERTTLPETTDAMRQYATNLDRKHVPPQPFMFDGCTFFIDSLFASDFTDACLAHDMAYWRGGTSEERRVADQELKEALRTSGIFGNIVSYPAYIAVRLFGDSVVTRSVHAHWGFGWE